MEGFLRASSATSVHRGELPRRTFHRSELSTPRPHEAEEIEATCRPHELRVPFGARCGPQLFQLQSRDGVIGNALHNVLQSRHWGSPEGVMVARAYHTPDRYVLMDLCLRPSSTNCDTKVHNKHCDTGNGTCSDD